MGKISCVCIIDDDSIFVNGVKALFRINRCCENFLVFKNGREAWNYFNDNLHKENLFPPLTLMDLDMPVMDGWELLKLLEKDSLPAESKLYIVSSSKEEAEINKAKSHQIVKDYVAKPLTVDKVKWLCEKVNEPKT